MGDVRQGRGRVPRARSRSNTTSANSNDHGSTLSVENYLDRLFDLLAGSGAAGRRALVEIEGHLCEATEEGVAGGLPRPAAERAAIARLGPVEQTAGGLLSSLERPGLRVIRRQIVGAAWLLGSAGALSVGIAGLFAWPVAARFGKDLIAADPPAEVLPASRCRYLLEYYPNAGGCQAASVAHHAEELVRNGLALGLLGAVALTMFWFARRGGRLRRYAVTPPAGIVAAVGTTMFGAAAAVLIESGASRLHAGARWGAGWSLVAGMAALPAFAVFAARLLRDLRLRSG